MSEEKHTIEVFLNAPQFLKYKKGKSFQLSNAQLQADSGNTRQIYTLVKKTIVSYYSQ